MDIIPKYWLDMSILTENVKIHLWNMWVVFKETFSSNLYLCIFNSTGNITLRFFSASSQNYLCCLSFCLVGVQIRWWTEVLQGVLPNLLVSTLMCNLSECSWRQLWAHEPDIWRSFAPNSRRTENRCSEMPENNRNKCKFFDVSAKNTFLRLTSWNHPGRWLCVTPMLQHKIGPLCQPERLQSQQNQLHCDNDDVEI